MRRAHAPREISDKPGAGQGAVAERRAHTLAYAFIAPVGDSGSSLARVERPEGRWPGLGPRAAPGARQGAPPMQLHDRTGGRPSALRLPAVICDQYLTSEEGAPCSALLPPAPFRSPCGVNGAHYEGRMAGRWLGRDDTGLGCVPPCTGHPNFGAPSRYGGRPLAEAAGPKAVHLARCPVRDSRWQGQPGLEAVHLI